MVLKQVTDQQVLDVVLPADNDAGAPNIRRYLKDLLAAVWENGEGFSGKRPFGNSDWEWELYNALAKAEYIEAQFDDHGYLDSCDVERARLLIARAIDSLQ